jgi:RNA polymerase sigma-70 factor (sigma-E family)
MVEGYHPWAAPNLDRGPPNRVGAAAHLGCVETTLSGTSGTGVSVASDEPGDAGGFEEFFHATWARLFRTTYAVAGDTASAEDALQAAYAKAYASWRRIRATDHPEAYVRRMAVNEVLGVRRRPAFRRERYVEAEPTPEPSPELALVDRDAVWRAVSALAPRQRAVVVLRYYEDLSEVEIAEVLGCSRGTVKSQASDALARLRALSTTGDLS